MELSIILVAIAGVGIAVYMMNVHHKKKKDPHYKPICDINNRVSCTAVFKTKYAKVFGVPNTILGLGMYVLLVLFEVIGLRRGTQILSGMGVAMSIYLTSGLVKNKIVCLMCIASYLIVTSIFVLSLL